MKISLGFQFYSNPFLFFIPITKRYRLIARRSGDESKNAAIDLLFHKHFFPSTWAWLSREISRLCALPELQFFFFSLFISPYYLLFFLVRNKEIFMMGGSWRKKKKVLPLVDCNQFRHPPVSSYRCFSRRRLVGRPDRPLQECPFIRVDQ